ncbi:magnesium/cobalt transporter CorA [Clostridium estertheticum]|uniref:magnesium/cobalt transporter CorA n=1 Tax=Clostridium estertheticum TaxID=238834 RepID=UPI001C7CB82B|nr:magnesium/cobalt transporter CorA [Clostridium estertheticum]MBX4259368.1 magnesium/cobalt transporter CorA [Clostridium estertheticum]WLC69373.1 magnesium/cobalt transporter CorA [Clostridium estertheticum]
MITYINNKVHEFNDLEKAFSKAPDTKEMFWLNISNPTANDFKFLKNKFNFHHLTIEDCMHKAKRSKINDYNDYHFLIISTTDNNVSNAFSYNNIYIYISLNYIITIHYGENKSIKKIMNDINNGLSIVSNGSDFVLYNILDDAIDQLFVVTDKVEEKINFLEEESMNNPVQSTLNNIMKIKKTVIKLRRVVSPLREVLNTLLRHDDIITEKYRVYFTDIYDHALRIYDLIESDHEMVTSCLELYSSQLSNSMNKVMKVLTIITTIMMPLTIITGIYGMNFQDMPELHYKYGYFITIFIMFFISFCEIIYFNKKKWL